MSEREIEIIRLALVFLVMNQDKAFRAFRHETNNKLLDFNGEVMDKPYAEEIEEILDNLQG